MKAIVLTLLFLSAPAYAGPGEGGGPRPGAPLVSETLPEGDSFERTDDMVHPREQRDREAEQAQHQD